MVAKPNHTLQRVWRPALTAKGYGHTRLATVASLTLPPASPPIPIIPARLVIVAGPARSPF